MWPFSNTSWKSIAQDKQRTRDDKLSKEHEGSKYSPYLNATASEIVENIRKGTWTATDVLEAYIAQTVKAHAITNCVTEVLFDDARSTAKALDQHFKETHELKGPLHGVPVSFKDLFNIAGYDSTIGFSKNAYHPAEEDAEVVRLVREAGGIPFVKTNVPQTLMFFECSNPVWGSTSNPFNQGHTAGGSSGGESALLAMDGSALGWGTDIGGSLRIPIGYCGIYALKPGYGRVTTAGTVETLPGFETVSSIVGPIGRSVADIELAARLTFGQGKDDIQLVPLPYRDVKLPTKLRFGYYTSEDYLKCSPAAQRAIHEAVEALRTAGHDCVEVPPPKSYRAIQLFSALITSDGHKTLLSPISHDPQDVVLSSLVLGPKLDGVTRSLLASIAQNVFGDSCTAGVLRILKKKSVTEYWRLVKEVQQFAQDFDKEMWEKHQLDGILAPVQAVPAMAHSSSTMVQAVSSATILYNVVEVPVGVVPITRVDPTKDQLTPDWYKVDSSRQTSLIQRFLYKGDSAIYNAEKMAGLPVAIQVVGKRWEDEKVIEMMKVVDEAVGPRDFGPGIWQRLKEKADGAPPKSSADE